ncbi:2-isopropylmalate synthase [Chitiniphilus shinanonensis]|uniref:2-isopropylmalate synthase n=1 Tax=Chitiniphilus shinanonensis TaxID=553088 RepID=F8WSS4_9NEIS|nr:2-isopropylmalate synthase [Chitiniphilus shinanonensis]BAK53911.1 2-isopropylmalate synthase [Chitiniphilus shinanonensis]GLS06276.1 2-isopropylmalate synthase [Chitiniphilus shinanonensis]
MIADPSAKYRGFQPIALPDRQWPNAVLRHPPIWMSTDLRDGNQALIEPMDSERKLAMFEALVKIGFKEIEVAFPSASQTDFDFVRKLIEEQRIPDDVTIEVLTQSREDLIRRSIESLVGARRAIVHLYNPIAPAWRRIVFDTDQAGVKALAVSGTRLIKQLTEAHPETEWVLQYSPETFSAAEVEFAKEVCDAVSDVWQPTPERKMIVNLPATVEMSTPNTYADQIEWMHRHLARRDSIVLSVHPHNDRGTAVAAAELAVMAGADRVEGCLFGSGERTGNVDLVTLALNLYSQGVHPGLDFSDIDRVRQVAEHCTQLPVHPRHPYAGDLVFTAFSGSHQDAIRKGMAQQRPDQPWEVPYLPIDPADVGRGYDAVIRVNSQSGKGGMAYVLEQEHGFVLPRRMQIEFSRVIQHVADDTGGEVTGSDLFGLFRREYLDADTPWRYRGHRLAESHGHADDAVHIEVELEHAGQVRTVSGTGNGPVDALVNALAMEIEVVDYHEHALAQGAAAAAACYVELRVHGGAARFGAGVDDNIVAAAIKAVLSGVNRSR